METVLEAIQDKKIVLWAGPGGVGKTTSSAALGLALARGGKKTCVLTIDPAKRLADALGTNLGNQPTKIDLQSGLGDTGEGELWCLMLDPKETLEDLIRSHANDSKIVDRVLNNAVFNQLSGAMAGTLEYTAIEKLYDLTTNFSFDIIVVDTPPSKNVLDFLEAPDYVARFLEESIFRWFVMFDPKRASRSIASSILQRTGKVIWDVLSKALGADFVDELLEFFRVMEFLASDFRLRAVSLGKMMRSSKTGTLVVGICDPVVLKDVGFLAEEISKRKIEFLGYVVNRTAIFPRSLSELETARSELETVGVFKDPSAQLWDRLVAVADEQRTAAETQDRVLAEFRSEYRQKAPLAMIPRMAEDIHDLSGLMRVAAHFGAVSV